MIDPMWRKSLICGDSKALIKRIPDNSIDLILTDPPYNLAKHSTGNIPLPGRSAMNNDVAEWDLEDFIPSEWADEFVRILKPTGNLFIFTSYNQIGKWYDSLDHRFDASNFMVWHKTNPAPKIFKAGFLNSCELVFTCWNKKHTWNFKSQAEMHNFMQSSICMKPERLSDPKHPTQKPVSILRHIIQIASNPGDIVFDPFMGVGSTGVAALMEQRRYIGVEISPVYTEAARKRVKMETANDTLFVNEPTVAYASTEAVTPFLEYIEQLDIKEYVSKKTPQGEDDKDNTFQPRPLIKWPGGKERELDYIMPYVPNEINRYFEPFIGGGAVFANIEAKEYYINDLSTELIEIYRLISEQSDEFISLLNDIDDSWIGAQELYCSSSFLFDTYVEARGRADSDSFIRGKINLFIEQNTASIHDLLHGVFHGLHDNKLTEEIQKNLLRKMKRMLVLEQQKHRLPDSDVHDNIETAIKSGLYMYYRNLYNLGIGKGCALGTAIFVFIRNYAYSGMFRFNDKGEFNVPYGGMAYNSKLMRKKTDYYSSSGLRCKLAKTNIFNRDFEQFLCDVEPREGDFIFLDPPYDTEFSTYDKNEFTRVDQKRLAHFLINDCRAHWMLVIKNTDFIYDLYNRNGIYISSFDKKYAVSFMNRNNRKVTHLLITNYPVTFS